MDPKFRIYFEGLPDDAIRSAEKVVTSLNKANDAQKRYSRERQQLARTERQERFRELSQEEQYQRLLQRREQLERRLAQARARGQGSRVDALELLAARNRSALRGYAPPVLSPAGGGGGLGGIAGMLLGQLAGRAGGGMLGGLIGSLGGPLGVAAGVGGGLMLGDLARRLGGAMTSAVRGALEFADQINDLADQTGLSSDEVLRMQSAAASVGVGTQKAFGSISTLGAARSAALSGDANSLALFSRYGISREMLGSDTNDLSIAGQITQSLGAGGITATDQGPLRSLLGRRPDQAIAVLKAYLALASGAAGDAKAALDELNKVQAKIDAAKNAYNIFRAKIVADTIDFWEKNASAMAEVASGIAKVTGLGAVAGAGAAMIASNPLTRWLATQGLIRGSSAAAQAGLFGGGNTTAGDRTADPAPFSTQLSAALKSQAIQRFQQADSLSRVGIFTGASGVTQAGLAKAQFEKLAEMVRVQIETRNLMKVKL